MWFAALEGETEAQFGARSIPSDCIGLFVNRGKGFVVF